MTRRSWMAGVAVVHAAVAMACTTYAFGASMARFDDPALPIGAAERITSVAASVLLWPGRLVWGSWAAAALPDSIEWLLVAANSVLWAWGIVTAAAWLARTGGGRDSAGRVGVDRHRPPRG